MFACGKVRFYLGVLRFLVGNLCVEISVNYQRNWKFAAVLKPDGSTPNNGQMGGSGGGGGAAAAAGMAMSSVVPATTKYYKRSIISHPNQVPPY